MIEFFKTIGQFIANIGDTLNFLLGNLHYVFDSICACLDIGVLFFNLPSFLSGVAVITLVIAIVFTILRVFHG